MFGPFRVYLVLGDSGGGEYERKYENVSVDVDNDVVSSPLHHVRIPSEPLKTQR